MSVNRFLRTALPACLLSAVVALPFAGQSFADVASRPASPTSRVALEVPGRDQRTPDQTYLTFPEWFLVFSPAEYATSLQAAQAPSAFPFFGHIAQFWSAYRQVIGAISGRFPFNAEYHTMIVVIGVSTTLEYTVKGSYEILVGRLTELTSPPNATPEDRLATKQAQAYVDFVRVRPWYEFDFVSPLRALWTHTPWWGPHALRKWERRYALTSEWVVKAAYAALLKQATRSTYDAPSTATVAIVEGLTDDTASTLPDLRRLRKQAGHSLVSLPRYQAFTDNALVLSRRGVRFVDIAGNRGDILVSVVAPVPDAVPRDARVLIRQPIVTRPGMERRVLEVPVAHLARVLQDYDRRDMRIEHVFDY